MSQGYGVIYRVTNTINGKKYVGQTTAEPYGYWRGHLGNARKGHKKMLYYAIKKHGEDAFTFEVVWSALDKASLDVAEDFFIVEEKTMFPLGYNMKGGGHTGKFSEQMRRNHSLILKKALAPPEVRERMSAVARKARSRPEVKRRASAAMVEVWQRPEHRAVIAETNAKPEVIARKSAARQEVLSRPGHIELVRQSALNQFSVPGSREAVAERTRQQFADPEKAARHRAAYDNPDTKAKLSAQNAGRRWYTNGEKDVVLYPDEELPPGRWRRGMSRKSIGASRCQWINNGVECRMAPKDEPLSEGWKLGKLDLVPNARNAGKYWITDGTRNQMIETDDPISEGWRRGMTRDGAPRAHARWHVARGIVDPLCVLCAPSIQLID